MCIGINVWAFYYFCAFLGIVVFIRYTTKHTFSLFFYIIFAFQLLILFNTFTHHSIRNWDILSCHLITISIKYKKWRVNKFWLTFFASRSSSHFWNWNLTFFLLARVTWKWNNKNLSTICVWIKSFSIIRAFSIQCNEVKRV